MFWCAELPADGELTLGGPEGRHAADVLRLRPGEQVVITDGRGGAVSGPVRRVGRGEVTVAVALRSQQPAASPRLVVAQALVKGERAELAVELLTELGADEILPWRAQRCVARWDGERTARGLARWRATAAAAAKQSRRHRFPEVGEPVDTAALAARLATAALPVVLHESAGTPLSALSLPAGGEVVIVVGPEGGIGESELAQLGAPTYRLGDTVLRSSTAGAVALAVLAIAGRAGAAAGYREDGVDCGRAGEGAESGVQKRA